MFYKFFKWANPLHLMSVATLWEGEEDGGGGDDKTWHSGLPEDIQNDPSLASFKDESEMVPMPVNVARSFISTKKLVGRDKIPMPTTEEEWAQTFDRLGRPESPDLYDVPIPENIQNPKLKDALESDREWFKTAAHEIGLNADQANKLFTKYAERNTERIGIMDAEADKLYTDGTNELRNQYGSAYEGKLVLTDRAVERLDQLSPGFVDLLKSMNLHKHPVIMKALIPVGEMMAEDFGLDKEGQILVSRDSVQEQLSDLMQSEAYTSANHPAHAATVQKVFKLRQQISDNKPVGPLTKDSFI